METNDNITGSHGAQHSPEQEEPGGVRRHGLANPWKLLALIATFSILMNLLSALAVAPLERYLQTLTTGINIPYMLINRLVMAIFMIVFYILLKKEEGKLGIQIPEKWKIGWTFALGFGAYIIFCSMYMGLFDIFWDNQAVQWMGLSTYVNTIIFNNDNLDLFRIISELALLEFLLYLPLLLFIILIWPVIRCRFKFIWCVLILCFSFTVLFGLNDLISLMFHNMPGMYMKQDTGPSELLYYYKQDLPFLVLEKFSMVLILLIILRVSRGRIIDSFMLTLTASIIVSFTIICIQYFLGYGYGLMFIIFVLLFVSTLLLIAMLQKIIKKVSIQHKSPKRDPQHSRPA